MTAASTSPQNSRFAHSTHVAISHLGPPLDAGASHHIRAVVALVWPYSSSTRALSLLLAEPDIRLRKGKGQVKVTFRGPSAEAVAKGQVGIGDIVKLGLAGAQWIKSNENVSTPGKKIEWDLAFDGKANLDVKRESQILASIDVDRPVQVPATVSPPSSRYVETSLNGHGSTQYLHDSNSWSSPAFVKGKRLSSGSFLDASLDPFADDDGFVVGKGRKRSKFARHSDSWRLLERTPSPEKDTVEQQLDGSKGSAETAASVSPPDTVPNADEIEILDDVPKEPRHLESMPGSASATSDETHLPSPLLESQSNEVDPATLRAVRSPYAVSHQAGRAQSPDTPLREPTILSGMTAESVTGKDTQSPVRSDLKTPHLGPLPSSGLPLVSPLIRRSGLSTDYFPEWNSRSELDVPGDHQQPVTIPQARISSKPLSAPSSDVENPSPHLPVESEMGRAPDSEVTVNDARFDSSPPLPEGSLQFDQPFPAIPWPSSYEEVPHPHVMLFEHAQTSTNGKGSDFEFLNTSPLEPSNSAQHIWSHLGTSLDTMATLQAPSEADLLDPADTLVPPSVLPHGVTWKISQYGSRTPWTPDEVAKSDATVGHVVAAAQNENVNAESELTPESFQQVPVDPSLVNSLEAATESIKNIKDYAEVTEEAQEQTGDSHRWSDKVDVSAVDAESQRVYTAPPFPFQQLWHRRPSGQRSRRSSQYASLDGASDEVSADESFDVEVMSDNSHRLDTFDHEKKGYDGVETNEEVRAPSPALSPPPDVESRPQSKQMSAKDEGISSLQALDSSQSVVVVDSSDEDAAPSDLLANTVKDAIPSATLGPTGQTSDFKPSEIDVPGKEAGMGVGELYESATDRIEGPSLQSGSAHDETSSPLVDAAAAEGEGGQGEISAVRHQDLAGESPRPPAEPRTSSELPDEVHDQLLRHQLFTPENTQQERGDLQIQDQIAELEREISLPPTPQNTQEYTDVPQPTLGLLIEPIAKVQESQAPNVALPASDNELSERRRSPRLSRKFPPSQEMTEVVVPRSTQRRTSQLLPQDQPTTPNRLTVSTGKQARVDDATQTTEKENKPTDISLTQEEVAAKSQLTAHLTAGLTTSFSYYTSLSLLQDQFTQSVDVLALSTTASAEPQKAKSGPRDWHTTLHLIDPSLHGNKTITAQIFRPYKTALPKVQRGNVVLLRSFKVQSQKRKCMLLSTDSSAWTVFAVHEESGHEVSKCDAVIVGPPVEYGSEEISYATELKKWWVAEGDDQHPTEKHASQTSKAMPVAEKGDGAEVTHVLRDGTTYQDHTEGGDEVTAYETYHELRDGKVYQDPPVTKTSESDGKRDDADADEDEPAVFHELRDGTLYQDPPVAKTSKSDRENGEADADKRENAVLHELRDGTLYEDDIPTLTPRDQKRSRSSGTTESSFHNGDIDATEPNISADENVETNEETNEELESIGFNVKDELESGEESPTNEAVSSQIYHELRNGRRYVDTVPAQMRAGELQQQDEENEGESVIHELRDGVTYTDD